MGPHIGRTYSLFWGARGHIRICCAEQGSKLAASTSENVSQRLRVSSLLGLIGNNNPI